jgi:hypothetical protein
LQKEVENFQKSDIMLGNNTNGGIYQWLTKLPMIAYPAALVLMSAPLVQFPRAMASM